MCTLQARQLPSSATVSKIQFGTAWWFNDNLDGMREQMKALANLGVLGKFVGMVTDSRSFLSYPRHEYFRRILCGFIGDMVEKGLYPYDKVRLCEIVKDISYRKRRRVFRNKTIIISKNRGAAFRLSFSLLYSF
jgi:glucuronate isomerase